MKLNISGHHVENTDSLKSYAPTNLEKRFYRITSTNVILWAEKKRQKTESTIHISGGENYAVFEDKDFCSAPRLIN
jgi:putative sigma-54 modulation protein